MDGRILKKRDIGTGIFLREGIEMGTAVFTKFPRDSKFEGMKVLNIGCGMGKYESPNVTNVDAYDICKPNVTWNLEKTPLPFKDETFDLIIANHILEHLHNWWACFEDCARILKTGGQIVVYLPSFSGDSGEGYRDHVSYINWYSFFGVHGTDPDANAWSHSQKSVAKCLKLINVNRVYFNHWWIKYAPKFLQRWMGFHLRNIVCEDGYTFIKLKGGG